MAVTVTIDAAVPAGTSMSITFYEDVGATGVTDNEQTVTVADGSNQHTLNNLQGGAGNDYWWTATLTAG